RAVKAAVHVFQKAASALQRGQQVHPRLLPVAADAAVGAAQQGGDLGLGQAAEIAQLDHARELVVDIRQPVQGGVQRQHVFVQAQAAFEVVRQIGDAVQVAAALLCKALAGVVDHHAAHRRGGVGEEVPAIVELDFAPA